jgi:hypothetical protein
MGGKLVKFGKNFAEMCEMNVACGDQVTSRTQASEWYKVFKEGRKRKNDQNVL